MAQHFIKIFDDTVLKQSVNQGFESQRTNSRLGQFTMGELAFTRDTARLFVGNFTNKTHDKDSSYVIGGSLVGNKYLGLIDSKPLTHFSGVDENNQYIDTCVHLPLNYETKTLSREFTTPDGETYHYEEAGLFTADSKFRTDKNNGWSKESVYNPEYDAYNGDFLFDTFNNALILFDKGIKPIPVDETNNEWIVNEDTQVQKFYKPDGSFYTEEGDKSNYSTVRTRIHNPQKIDVSKTTEVLGNPDYPIYGNGYVVMRIVEPDGITIGYVEKQFNQDTGIAVKNNYSHNYLEVKTVRPDTLLKSLDQSQFFINGQGLISTSGGSGNTSIDILPTTLNFANGFVLDFTNATNKEGYLYSYSDNNEIKTGVFSAPVLTFLKDKKELTTVSLVPGENITISLDPVSDDDDDGTTDDSNQKYIVRRPFYLGNEDSYVYSGADIYDFQTKQNIAFEEVPEITDKNFTLTEEASCGYFVLYDSSGNSTYTTKTNPDISDEDTDNTYYEATFVHPYVNTGLNFLKNPEHIAWGTGNAQGKFFINPYVFCPSGLKEGDMGTVGTVDPVWPTPSGDEKWNSTFVQDNYIVPINSLGVHIPDHAQSIICELHIPSFYLSRDVCCVTTSAVWNKCIKGTDGSILSPSGNFVYNGEISTSSVPTMNSEFNKYNHIKILKRVHDQGEGGEDYANSYQVYNVEIPLYRDENQMKYFNVGIIYSRAWVLRAIGYRA